MRNVSFVPLLLFVGITQFGIAIKLRGQFRWKELSFDWPSDFVRNVAIDNKQYIPENNMPLGLDIWKDKLFITVPRFDHNQ